MSGYIGSPLLGKSKNAQVPFHDLPAEKLIEKLEIVKHKTTLDEEEAALFLNRTLNAMRTIRAKKKVDYWRDGDRVFYEMSALLLFKKKNRVAAIGHAA